MGSGELPFHTRVGRPTVWKNRSAGAVVPTTTTTDWLCMAMLLILQYVHTFGVLLVFALSCSCFYASLADDFYWYAAWVLLLGCCVGVVLPRFETSDGARELWERAGSRVAVCFVRVVCARCRRGWRRGLKIYSEK